jgi:hypothetical protein
VNKRKNSPALFELIGKGKAAGGEERTAVPKWMTGAKDEPVEAPVAPEVDSASPPAEPGDVREPAAAPSEPGYPGAIFSTAGGRLTLSLNHTNAVIVGVVFVLALAAVFMLGRSASPSATTAAGETKASIGEPASLRVPPADKGKAAGEAAASKAPAAEKRVAAEGPPPAVKRSEALEKGKYYLVIQGVPKDEQHLQEAQKIADFCNERGEKAKVFGYPNNQYVVISLTPFEMKDSDEAKKYVRAIENLGKVYSSKHGQYSFKQPPDGWWHIQK